MNSKSIQYDNAAKIQLEKIAARQESLFGVITRKVSEYIARVRVEQSLAAYRLKREQEEVARTHSGIVDGMSLQDKQRFGMHRHL